MTRGLLSDPSARRLAAGELEAVFLPQFGMLGASLRHRGIELLRRVDDLYGQAKKGSTAGIPLLYPWANRLAGLEYEAAGKRVVLDPSSEFLRLDEQGLPIHGVPWSRLAWDVFSESSDHVVARLAWNRDDLLAIFPFRHDVELSVRLDPAGLTVGTTIIAADALVPVSFGFHPYVAIPGLPRTQWRLQLPAMRKLLIDAHGIPIGKDQPFEAFDGLFGDLSFDDGFAVLDERTTFAISGAARRISVTLVEGYSGAQIFAPRDRDFIALEPMTAPTSALTSGRGLRLVQPGAQFRSAFQIIVESYP